MILWYLLVDPATYFPRNITQNPFIYDYEFSTACLHK
jgi:hypothetical protein